MDRPLSSDSMPFHAKWEALRTELGSKKVNSSIITSLLSLLGTKCQSDYVFFVFFLTYFCKKNILSILFYNYHACIFVFIYEFYNCSVFTVLSMVWPSSRWITLCVFTRLSNCVYYLYILTLNVLDNCSLHVDWFSAKWAIQTYHGSD